jgi:hypothetical protein
MTLHALSSPALYLVKSAAADYTAFIHATEKHAVVVATAAVDKHKQLKDVAQFVKHEMDLKFPATKATEGVYHCVVGKSFASESGLEDTQFGP